MTNSHGFSVIILAGGASRRMGQDKRVISLGGKPLTTFSIELAKRFSQDIIISANDNLAIFDSYKIVADIEKGAGPVNAIISSLNEIKNESAVIVTCDMPFLSNDLIEILIQKNKRNTVTHFSDAEKFYPFPSIFPISLLQEIRKLSNSGNNSMKSLLSVLPTNKIPLPADTTKYAFLNVNHQREFEKARDLYPSIPDIEHNL